MSYMGDENEVDPGKGVEFIDGVNLELGVENPLLGGGRCHCPVEAGGLISDDPTGL